MQQLTCKMVWSFFLFYSLLFSFTLFLVSFEQNPLNLKKKSWGKFSEKCEKCGKV